MKLRRGMALVLALLVLVLLELMSAGIVALATQSRLVSGSELQAVRAQTAAEAAVQTLLNNWQRARFDTLPAGTYVNVPVASSAADEQVSATVERLQLAVYRLQADARVGGGGSYAVARATALARTLDRAALLAESTAAVASAGPLVLANGATVSADAGTLPPAWSDSLCPATGPLPVPNAVASAFAPAISTDVTISGGVLLDSTLALPDSVAVGGVKWSELAAIADVVETGNVTPAPAVLNSTCVPATHGNWGDATRADGPCGRYFPLIFSDGDLAVVGGQGQGILAVAGIISIAGDFQFNGLIVARDGISISGSAKLFGAIRSRGGYALVEAANIAYSRCALARAAYQTSSGQRIVPSSRRFIPSF